MYRSKLRELSRHSSACSEGRDRVSGGRYKYHNIRILGANRDLSGDRYENRKNELRRQRKKCSERKVDSPDPNQALVTLTVFSRPTYCRQARFQQNSRSRRAIVCQLSAQNGTVLLF